MFTGIIEATGSICSIQEQNHAWRMVIEAAPIIEGVQLGDSIAVNGCCLTVVAIVESKLSFDLLEESIQKTNFAQLPKAAHVNLERALLPSTRMGGHFVSGHLDALGTITSLKIEGKDVILSVTPENVSDLRYVIPKGSICLDGISLTVYTVSDNDFSVWLIPHTLEVTNLHAKSKGDAIHIEYDMIPKYLEKLKLQS